MSSGCILSRQGGCRLVASGLVEVGVEQVDDHPGQAPLEDPSASHLDLPAAGSRVSYAWAGGWTRSW
jgi:hypothetical protein